MYAVITVNDNNEATRQATARVFTVAQRKAEELLNEHDEVIVAYAHPNHYEPIIKLTDLHNTGPIWEKRPEEEYTTNRFVYGRSLTFKASHKAVYIDVYQHGKAIDTISAYDYKADKSKLDNPKAFHEAVDLYTVRVAPNYMDTIAY